MSTKNKAARGRYYGATAKKKCDHRITVEVSPRGEPCTHCGKNPPKVWRCVDCGALTED